MFHRGAPSKPNTSDPYIALKARSNLDLEAVATAGVHIRPCNDLVNVANHCTIVSGQRYESRARLLELLVCSIERKRQGARGEIGESELGEHLSLIFHLKGRGLVILAPYIGNSVTAMLHYLQQRFGAKRIHAIVGGFTDKYCSSCSVDRVVNRLASVAPQYMAPTSQAGPVLRKLLERRLSGRVLPASTRILDLGGSP